MINKIHKAIKGKTNSAMQTSKKKPKVGFYGITGCAGCLLSVAFNEDELLDIVGALDIVSFPFIKEKNSNEEMDICFIEGTVVSKDDLEHLRELRSRSKVLVALGACASQGNIPAMRNFADKKNLERLKYEKVEQIQDVEKPAPLHHYVDVDYSLPGCPPDRDEIKTFIKEILLGKIFRNYPDPVCRECRLLEKGCLLEEGKPCLGPITRGGCHAVCTAHGFDCYGCRGLTDDAHMDSFFKLMKEKNIPDKIAKKRMDTFMSLEVNEKLKDTKWEKLH